MTQTIALLCATAFALFFSSTRLAKSAADAPGLLLAVGLTAGVAASFFGVAGYSAGIAALAAKAGLGAIGFACAAELRVSKLAKQCPSSWRLTLGGAPLFFVACSLCGFVMLPQLSFQAALLLGAIMTLNGAAFDKRAVVNAPAPAPIKAAVRFESAAIIALGLPVALLFVGYATAPQPNEAALAPLLRASLSVLKGFAFGGVLGLLAAMSGAAYRRRTLQMRALDGQIAIVAGVAAFCAAPFLGGDPIIAAAACGLLWGEQTSAAGPARLRVRRFTERVVRPFAYLGFGVFVAPRLFQADLLAVVFALSIVTIVRVAPRLAVLQSPELPRESQFFLAWFGGAPGAASALFAMTLLDNPALIDADAILIVSALAVSLGVFATRLTSRPLANAFLRETALTERRRQFAH